MKGVVCERGSVVKGENDDQINPVGKFFSEI
jgi:hypothetical protein